MDGHNQNSWTLIHVMPVCRQLLLRNDPGRESSLHMPPSHREGGNVRGTLSLVRPSLTDSVCGRRRRRVEVVNAVDDRRRRAEGEREREGTIVGPLGVKRGRKGGTYLYLLPRLSPGIPRVNDLAVFLLVRVPITVRVKSCQIIGYQKLSWPCKR